MKPTAELDNERIIALLPRQLVDIARVIGVSATLKLVAARGGIRLHVPNHVSAEHPIAQIIGHGEALKLVDAFRGERLEIPVSRTWRLAIRNAAIAEERKRGTPQPAVARNYGMTERMVRIIERQAEDNDDGQIGLF